MDVNETESKKKIVNNPDVSKIIKILESFLKRQKLVCYGGTAIDNILPKNSQFYDKSIEIPDYDFYSSNALDDSKELADIYHSSGYL
jgi:Poly(A) polymerase catalytic subunit